LRITIWGLTRGIDKGLYPVERAFFYMPLCHSENIQHQKQAVELFEQLEEISPASIRLRMSIFRNYAVDSYKTIEKFGRFPQRNEVLGRVSTAEEIEFLAERS